MIRICKWQVYNKELYFQFINKLEPWGGFTVPAMGHRFCPLFFVALKAENYGYLNAH